MVPANGSFRRIRTFHTGQHLWPDMSRGGRLLTGRSQAASSLKRNKTGQIVPVSLGRLPYDHVRVWRLTTEDAASYLGRFAPTPLMANWRRLRYRNQLASSGSDTAKPVLNIVETVRRARLYSAAR